MIECYMDLGGDIRIGGSPSEPHVKLNFDATYKGNTKRSYSRSPLMPTGLIFCERNGINFVMVEGDSRSTITKINQEKEDGSRIEAYIKDIKNLTQVFISIKFNYIPRMANNVVHRLAREGLQMNEETYWVEDIHDSVRSVVEEDRRRINPG
ncbi:hypothetical protein Golax_018065 [Gossypium laxum]|uniref:RNase H type-1 domain-containing protein n=2 Tax=Gossypium TaxID=3633 RepID=A0A7J8Z248_9ROSI|nr:hypothetical protein [Gossypium laxum]